MSDPPRHADAIVLPSGDNGERIATAMPMLDAGLAKTLVIVGDPDLEVNVRLCTEHPKFDVICLRPAHDSTRAEAQATARLAASRHWHHITVVTTTFHVARARLLFRRCWSGRVDVIGAKPSYGQAMKWRQTKQEWLRLAAQTLLLRC